MNRLFYIVLLIAIVSCRSAGQPESPNIILIMSDDLGWGDVGFNGNQIIRTPYLDALAAKGIVFDRFYSASPVCSPTRASCLTGRNPYRIDIPTANAGHMRKEEITLAEILKARGYRTGMFGKWHLGTLTTEIKDANRGRPGKTEHFSIPTQHGFDVFFCTESKVPVHDPMLKPLSFATDAGESLRYGWKAITNPDSSEFYGTHYWEGEEQVVDEPLRGNDAGLIMTRAMDFMEESYNSGKPFFAVIWLHAPHLPVVADVDHRNMYSSHGLREQLYYGAITAMDKEIGGLWKKLQNMGLSQNTMLWFCSDNGPERDTPGSAGQFRERKRSLYEGGVRVPAFFVWEQAVKPGQRTDFPAVTSDYLPTIVDLLSLPPVTDRPLDGISLKDVVLNSKEQERDKPVGFLFGKKMSWVTDRYKLISVDSGKTFELYDLMTDPSETQDIAAREPELVTAMKKALFSWKASVAHSRKGGDY